MKSKPNPVASVVFAVLPMADIQKLSIKEACARFAERATVTQRAFAEMGKLHHAISASLKKGQTIYGELRKVGVKDSTISNASYASRVFDLVATGPLTEAEYDTFTFADCLAICRVTGKQSKRQIGPDEVGVIVRAKPDSFDVELTSIYETGLTVEEAEAQAKAEADRKAKEEADAKAEADRKAAEKAEAEKQAAVAAALQAEREAAAATAVAPPAEPAAATAEPPAPAPEASAPVEPASEAPNPDPAPAEPAPAPVNVENMPGAAPAPVAQAPSADPDANLVSTLSVLDDVLVETEGMSLDAQKAIFAKLNDVLGAIGERITAAEKAAA